MYVRGIGRRGAINLMAQISDAEKKRQSSFGFLMQLIARRIDNDMKDRLAEIGIDKKLFANLMLLAENDGITQREIGRTLEFPEYFTSRTVDVLVKQELAERRTDPASRRTVLVYLTDLGREKAKQLPSIVAAVNAEYLAPLSVEERKLMIKLMHKVAKF